MRIIKQDFRWLHRINEVSGKCFCPLRERKSIVIADTILARHAGFCFGVRRAVDTAAAAAPAITLGPIIHNPQMVETLREKGVVSVSSIEEIPRGAKVVIRSHGVGRREIEALEERDCQILDATCPFVARIHEMARKASRAGIPVIVIGE